MLQGLGGEDLELASPPGEGARHGREGLSDRYPSFPLAQLFPLILSLVVNIDGLEVLLSFFLSFFLFFWGGGGPIDPTGKEFESKSRPGCLFLELVPLFFVSLKGTQRDNRHFAGPTSAKRHTGLASVRSAWIAAGGNPKAFAVGAVDHLVHLPIPTSWRERSHVFVATSEKPGLGSATLLPNMPPLNLGGVMTPLKKTCSSASS